MEETREGDSKAGSVDASNDVKIWGRGTRSLQVNG